VHKLGKTLSTTKGRGRPPKPQAQRKRANLTFRVRDELRSRLEAAATVAQRSVSEEIEHRLEASFRDEELLIDNLGGRAAQPIIRPLLMFFELLSLRGKDWTKNKETADTLSDAMRRIIDGVVAGYEPPVLSKAGKWAIKTGKADMKAIKAGKPAMEAIRSRQMKGAYQEALDVLELYVPKVGRT
jgi:hypothetical protein